jgi:hypothetical protein
VMDCTHSDRTNPAQHPRQSVRRIASLLIVCHFTAIMVAVTNADDCNLPHALRHLHLMGLLRPYLQLLFLTNRYRFFAPDPGGDTKQLYFHLLRTDGTTTWVELPHPRDRRLAALYCRRRALSDLAECDTPSVLIPSYVRRIAQLDSYDKHSSVTIATIDVYRAIHNPMSVTQARNGWSFADIRLYEFIHLGRFNAVGLRLDAGRSQAITGRELVELIVREDLIPQLHGDSATLLSSRGLAVAQSIGVPEPICDALSDGNTTLTGIAK